MKHPTDEEIEKAATIFANKKGDERPKFRSYIKDIKFTFEYAANWARDQQSKLKTLPWIAELTMKHIAVNDTGAWVVYQNLDNEQWFWYKDGFNYKVMPCDDLYHGKQLAQADYEKRVNELYEL